jgi:hypothetical protein
MLRSIFLSCLFALILQGCSKSSGSSKSTSTNPSSPYTLSATLGGKTWNANVYFKTYNSYVIGGVDYVNGQNYMVMIGLYAANGDTSQALTLVFPMNFGLTADITLDSAETKDIVYVTEDPLGSGKFDGYNSAQPTGGSGTIIVSNFDDVNQTLTGTFNCILGSDEGKKTGPLTFSAGAYNSPYVLQFNDLPSSALKFAQPAVEAYLKRHPTAP